MELLATPAADAPVRSLRGRRRWPPLPAHTELRQFLTEHGHHGGLGWFLDALGFTCLIRTALDSAAN